MKTARVVFRPGNATPHSYNAQVLVGDQQSGIARLNFAGQDLIADFPVAWPATPGTYPVKVNLRELNGTLVWEKSEGQVVVPVTVPVAPAPLSPANGAVVNGISITFRWNAVPGATNYGITVIKSDGSYLANALPVGNVTSYTIDGFPDDGSQYTWSVAAYNSAGWGNGVAWTFTNGAPHVSSLKDALTIAVGDNNAFPYYGMFFTATSDYQLTGIALPLKNKPSQAPVQIQLQHLVDAPNIPSLIPGYQYMRATLGQSLTTVPVLTNSYAWYMFDFAPIALSAGRLYLIWVPTPVMWQSGYVTYPDGGGCYIDYSYPYAISISSFKFNFKIYGRT